MGYPINNILRLLDCREAALEIRSLRVERVFYDSGEKRTEVALFDKSVSLHTPQQQQRYADATANTTQRVFEITMLRMP